MPDIREPYPIKPVWPTRPSRTVGEKKTPKTDKDQEKEQESNNKKQTPDDDKPHIDDYA